MACVYFYTTHARALILRFFTVTSIVDDGRALCILTRVLLAALTVIAKCEIFFLSIFLPLSFSFVVSFCLFINYLFICLFICLFVILVVEDSAKFTPACPSPHIDCAGILITIANLPTGACHSSDLFQENLFKRA